MRGKLSATKQWRLSVVGIPLAALLMLVAAEIDTEPVRYPSVSGEHQLESSSVGALERSDPIELATSAVGLRWPDGGSGEAAVRVSDDGVDWGPWIPIHADDHEPDENSGEGSSGIASEAVYTGGSSWIQVQWEGTTPVVDFVDTSGSTVGMFDRITAQLQRLNWSTESTAVAAVDQPEINPRSAWGGQDCVAPDTSYNSETRAEVVIVHHTLHAANANGYNPDEVADLLYAICSFHVGVRGWHDIGYNTLIDSSGRIWEGRGGGVDQPVRGAHAAGFNSSSVGVAFIGDHDLAPPSAVAQEAFVRYAAWRMDVAHIDPASVPVVVSRDSPTYPDGVAVPLRAISGHRDVGSTTCPGSIGYGMIGSLKERIMQVGGERIYGGWSKHEPVSGNAVHGYSATTFDFGMTSPSQWTFDLTGPDGQVVISETGSGTSASIPWSPQASLPHGTYVSRVTSTPIAGGVPARPALFEVVLGDFSPPFFDDEDSPHEWAIDAVARRQIARGCADLQFCPLDVVSRWQMALFLTRTWTSVGRTLPLVGDDGFVDVATYPDPTRQAIRELAALGLTAGVSATEFGPAGEVRRWEMALFLDRLISTLGVEVAGGPPPSFEDIAALPDDVKSAISRLVVLGITTGTSDRTYDPNSTVTREQMATFLARTIASLPTESPTP